MTRQGDGAGSAGERGQGEAAAETVEGLASLWVERVGRRDQVARVALAHGEIAISALGRGEERANAVQVRRALDRELLSDHRLQVRIEGEHERLHLLALNQTLG